jgi:hypothetical protein
MYVWIYICTYMHTYKHTNTSISIKIDMHTMMCVNTYMYIYIYIIFFSPTYPKRRIHQILDRGKGWRLREYNVAIVFLSKLIYIFIYIYTYIYKWTRICCTRWSYFLYEFLNIIFLGTAVKKLYTFKSFI